MGQESLRQEIRAWWESRIEGQEDVSLPTLSDEAVAVFREDAEFCRRLGQEFLRPVVYEVGLALLSDRRGKVQRAAAASRQASLTRSRPTMYVPGATVAAKIEEEPIDWQKWLEHDPETGRHIVLFSMTKEQALRAAGAREKRADPDLRRAGLLRLAAGRLKPGQRIEEVWTAEALAQIERTLEVGRPAYSLGKGTIYDMMRQGAA